MATAVNRLRLPDVRNRVALTDGTTLCLRPVTPGDEPAVRRLLGSASEHSLRQRFFGAPDLARAARALVAVDAGDVGLIAEVADSVEIVAHAACLRTAGREAEVAFLVSDAWQGRGIGPIMLAWLAEAAATGGIETLTADVLPANHRMLSVFTGSGRVIGVRRTSDAFRVWLASAWPTPRLAAAA